MKQIIYLVFCLIMISSCKEIDKTMLYGKWYGVQLIEGGQVADKKVDDIIFNFQENKTYSYETSTYKEAGPFRTLEDKLYTTDTTASKKLEKVVRVIFLTTDSLHIQMNNQGVDQLLKCARVK